VSEKTVLATGAGGIIGSHLGEAAVAKSFRVRASRIELLNTKVPLAVLLAWIILYAPRPFSLGFYSDDWWGLVEAAQGSAPFSIARLTSFVGFTTAYAARPVAGFITFLISSLCGQSPVLYQVSAALLVLIASLSLRSLFVALLASNDSRQVLLADLAVVFWLSLPWSIATTAWPILAMSALPAQILYTEAARLCTKNAPLSRLRLVVIGLLFLGGYL
jgi:hypothetical protein